MKSLCHNTATKEEETLEEERDALVSLRAWRPSPVRMLSSQQTLLELALPLFFFFFAAEANIAETNPSVSQAAAAVATGVMSDEALPVV